ncbi:MAG TPA: class I SAM-dependent methyltransferase, partial [Gaiellaceae bacterium]|nr:class I SAM-dependent methyltransferase [Gaiellaceae bacterium]
TGASDYSLDRMAEADRYNAWLLDRARPYLGSRVLELGAGIGTFTEQLADGREVVAVEPDSALLPHLRANAPSATVFEGDVETAPPGPFDSAVCFNVLEHIADHAGALAAIRERLRPGGHLLLLVPSHPFLYGPIDAAFEHERRYAKESLRTLLETAGFRVVELRRVNPVGALGWLVAGRVLRRSEIPGGPLRAFDRAVPVLRALDRAELPLGLSLWAVAERPA